MSDVRPNIILLMTDEQKASATSIYGNRIVQTPAWEQAASEGTTFSSCFACSSICTPSRASLMTGTHVPVHGCPCYGRPVRPDLPQIPELLQAAGYRTGVVGHHDGMAGLNRGWDHEVDWLDLRFGLKQIFQEGNALANEPKPLRGWVSGAHPRPASEGLAARMTDYAIEFLERQADEPFFLHLAHLEPHPPYFPPEPYASMIDPDTIELPPVPVPTGHPRWQIEAAEEMYMPHAREHDIRLAIARYYGLVSYVDHELGRLLAYLNTKGLMERTWVIMTSDHGDYAGEHGLFSKSEALNDCLLHVPLVVRPPTGFLPRNALGTRNDGLVQLHDLCATVCGMAGIDVPRCNQGIDLLPHIQEDRDVERDAVFAAVGENRLKAGNFPQGLPIRGVRRKRTHMVRTKTAKYIEDQENGDELYELDNDPYELNCLDIDASSEQVKRLRGMLARWKSDCDAVSTVRP